MNVNKNVSIWRGDKTPPTQYHLWQKGDILLHYNGLEWIENKIPIASSEQDGLMSKKDKDKLDNLVYNGLDSDREDLALSAKLGKILLTKISDLGNTVYLLKGSVLNLEDLPINNLRIGDVYNIVNPYYMGGNRYPGGTNVVWVGDSWDPLGGTVDFDDYSTTEEVEEMINTLREEVEEVLLGISAVLYNLHSLLTLKVTPSIIERGVTTPITIEWGFKFNDLPMNPDSISIRRAATEISNDVNTKTLSDNISTTTLYSALSMLKGVPKSLSVSVYAYYPIYVGGSLLNQITDVTSLVKYSLKSSPSGSYNVTLSENLMYFWICVPNGMTVNKVTLSGFNVPMQAYLTVAVAGKGNYKCYRSTNTNDAGTYTLVVS